MLKNPERVACQSITAGEVEREVRRQFGAGCKRAIQGLVDPSELSDCGGIDPLHRPEDRSFIIKLGDVQ